MQGNSSGWLTSPPFPEGLVGNGVGYTAPLKFWVISIKLSIGSFAFLKHWVEKDSWNPL